jgi:uncharacterized membrane protein
MRTRQREWRLPAGLIALSAVPVLAGTARLIQLAGGPTPISADSRFTSSPLPVVLHVLCATAYALLGAFQFVTSLRNRRPGWHRASGRVLVVAGLGVAGSALWMTLFLPPQPGSGPLLFVLRLAFGPAMVAALLLGVAAIRGGDVSAHRAWMTRAYAIALAAGTQAFTQPVGSAVFGNRPLVFDVSSGAGWLINLTIAEWAIRRRSETRVRTRIALPAAGHR